MAAFAVYQLFGASRPTRSDQSHGDDQSADREAMQPSQMMMEFPLPFLEDEHISRPLGAQRSGAIVVCETRCSDTQCPRHTLPDQYGGDPESFVSGRCQLDSRGVLVVTHVSENIETVTGYAVTALLQHPLWSMLECEEALTLQHESDTNYDSENIYAVRTVQSKYGRELTIVMHYNGSQYVCDVMPRQPFEFEDEARLSEVELTERLASSYQPHECADAAVQLLNRVLMFDRCLVYRIIGPLDSHTAEIIAESQLTNSLAPFQSSENVPSPLGMSWLGLKFHPHRPDERVCLLFAKTKFRCVQESMDTCCLLVTTGSDTDSDCEEESKSDGHDVVLALSVNTEPSKASTLRYCVPPTNHHLDLSGAYLRFPTPQATARYLALGVRAALSSVIVINGLPWGALQCYSNSPRTISWEMRDYIVRVCAKLSERLTGVGLDSRRQQRQSLIDHCHHVYHLSLPMFVDEAPANCATPLHSASNTFDQPPIAPCSTMQGLLCGYPSITELMDDAKMGFAFVVEGRWIKGNECVPPHDWLVAVADWMIRDGHKAHPELHWRRTGAIEFDDTEYHTLLNALPDEVRERLTFGGQCPDDILCCNHLSNPALKGLPIYYEDYKHCGGMLAHVVSREPSEVLFFFRCSNVILSVDESAREIPSMIAKHELAQDIIQDVPVAGEDQTKSEPGEMRHVAITFMISGAVRAHLRKFNQRIDRLLFDFLHVRLDIAPSLNLMTRVTRQLSDGMMLFERTTRINDGSGQRYRILNVDAGWYGFFPATAQLGTTSYTAQEFTALTESCALDFNHLCQNGRRVSFERRSWSPHTGRRTFIMHGVFVLEVNTGEERREVFLLYLRDITVMTLVGQRILFAALQAMRAEAVKKLLVSAVSHELRGPLTAIIGFSDMAAEEMKSEPAATQTMPDSVFDHIEDIRAASAHMLQVATNILDLSRIDLSPNKKSRVDFCRIVREAGSWALHAMKKKGIQLCVRLPNVESGDRTLVVDSPDTPITRLEPPPLASGTREPFVQTVEEEERELRVRSPIARARRKVSDSCEEWPRSRSHAWRPCWVWGDPVGLKRVIVNLLDNACKATKAGGTVELAVRVIPSSSTDSNKTGYVELIIADSGIGISPENLVRIFQPFFTIDLNGHETRTGLGLGLPMVKAIVEQHTGSISVVSDVGKGTRFSIMLPYYGEEQESELVAASPPLLLSGHPLLSYSALNDTATMVQRQSPTTMQNFVPSPDSVGFGFAECKQWTEKTRHETSRLWDENGASFTADVCPHLDPASADCPSGGEQKESVGSKNALIVVVDDNKINRRLVSKMLDNEGFHHHEQAGDGLEAIQLAKHLIARGEPIGLILLDLHMPVCDGFEAATRIRELGVRCPMVALTAATDEEIKARCSHGDFDDFLTKPISRSVLQQCLNKHLKRQL